MSIASASPRAHAVLTMDVTGLRDETPTRANLTATFDLFVPADVQAAICDSGGAAEAVEGQRCMGGRPVAQAKSVCVLAGSGQALLTRYRLKPEYAAKSLTLSITSATSSGAPSVTVPFFSTAIPLAKLFPPELLFGGACTSPDFSPDTLHLQIAGSVTVPLDNHGQAYPDDWYTGAARLSIALPSGMYIPDAVSETGQLYYLPIDVRVVTDGELSGYDMRLLPGISGFIRNDSGVFAVGESVLALTATRSRPTWLLIYSMCLLVPGALALLLLHALFLSRRHLEEQLHNLLLNILIAALTVAAIRQLLVPSGLQQGLTRLDLILGTAGTVLLGLIFIRYAWQIWGRGEVHDKRLNLSGDP